MGLVEDYALYDATALAELVRTRQVTARELAEEAISRIERQDKALGAMMERRFDRARLEAAGGVPAGPFAGVPFLLKDNLTPAAGIPYHNGSRIWRGWSPEHDSTLVQRLHRAGLVLLGSTKAPELCLMPVTEPGSFGPARNPWDTGRTPGGSSGGSAAAVAAGWVPMAHATDGGGSIRIPASCCGLFGMKPTRGRTPLGPQVGEAWHGLSVAHAVTRSVRDSAALLDATHGADPGAPYHAPPPAGTFLEAAHRAPGRLRIAWSADTPNGAPVHAHCRAAVEAAARLAAELGHEVAEGAPPIDAGLYHDFMTLFFTAAALELEEAEAATGIRPALSELEAPTALAVLIGRSIPGHELAAAKERLYRASRRIAAFFEEVDVLLTPTLAQPPLPVGALAPRGFEAAAQKAAAALRLGGLIRRTPMLDEVVDRTFAFIPFTPPFNVTGQPAASIPLHWTAEGLPIGVQAVGRFGEEATLFSLAAQMEAARPWVERRPAGLA